MTRNKKYTEETVLFARRVPKSKLADIASLVEKYLERFKINKIPDSIKLRPLLPEECFDGENPKVENFLPIKTDGKPMWPGLTNPKEKLNLEYVDPISNEQLVKEKEFLDLNPAPDYTIYTGAEGVDVIKKVISEASGQSFVEKLIPIEDKINRLELKKAQNLAKKTVPKDLVEKLKELDPNIIIPESGIKPPEWAKKHKTVIKNTTETHYPCGCSFDGLFRRNSKCKLKIEDHKL